MKLLRKFAIVFMLFSLVTLVTSGIATYVHQTKSYQSDQERKLQEIASFLSLNLQMDGTDFATYQEYFVNHYGEMNIPYDFDMEEMLRARSRSEELFAKRYPGLVLGKDVSFQELPEDVQHAYAIYNHEYYLLLFEKAAKTFGLTYCYYIVPTGEELHMYWMLDAVREQKTVNGESYIELAIDALEPREKHEHMWEAWETGMAPSGYDVYDDSYELGMTYAWYAPLYINGQKLGLIGTEVGIEDYNHAILMNTLEQVAYVAIILLLVSVLALVLIDRLYISKIRRLSAAVGEYAQSKDASIAGRIEEKGRDELCTLRNQTSQMILGLDNYMKSLVATTEELFYAKERVGIESELARKDALTGVRNRVAYEEEVKRLTWQMLDGKTEFGFAVVDVNFLKRINDTYGHEAGNRAIKECCAAVCKVFAHSPVFRIGGDEFVVVLEGEDYGDAQRLADDFVATQGSFSAAIGLALYDKEKDGCVENVFSRADKAMYLKKKEMKALR